MRFRAAAISPDRRCSNLPKAGRVRRPSAKAREIRSSIRWYERPNRCARRAEDPSARRVVARDPGHHNIVPWLPPLLRRPPVPRAAHARHAIVRHSAGVDPRHNARRQTLPNKRHLATIQFGFNDRPPECLSRPGGIHQPVDAGKTQQASDDGLQHKRDKGQLVCALRPASTGSHDERHTKGSLDTIRVGICSDVSAHIGSASAQNRLTAPASGSSQGKRLTNGETGCEPAHIVEKAKSARHPVEAAYFLVRSPVGDRSAPFTH